MGSEPIKKTQGKMRSHGRKDSKKKKKKKKKKIKGKGNLPGPAGMEAASTAETNTVGTAEAGAEGR